MDQKERNRRRRFGQNDLSDPVWLSRILDTIEDSGTLRDSSVLEIGAGLGTLTLPLLHRGARVAALELDPERVRRLLSVSVQESRLAVRQGDATDARLLAELLDSLPMPRRVIGSLPYNAATPILDRLLEVRQGWIDAHAVIQLEVAQRLAASPGSASYGYLSVITQLRAEVSIPLQIPPAAFRPRPKVASALTRLVPRPGIETWKPLRQYLSTAFSTRRKTLRNCLKRMHSADRITDELGELGIRLDARAEQLSPEQHVELWQRLDDNRQRG